jgi:hypothetical protein
MQSMETRSQTKKLQQWQRLVVYVAQIAEAAAAFREELANNYFQSYEKIQYSLNYIFDV